MAEFFGLQLVPIKSFGETTDGHFYRLAYVGLFVFLLITDLVIIINSVDCRG